jgi:hypothetical protein
MQLASKEAEVLHGIGADLKAIMEYGNSSGHASQRCPPPPSRTHGDARAHTTRARMEFGVRRALLFGQG